MHHGHGTTDVRDPTVFSPTMDYCDRVNAVGRELLVVRPQIRGRISQFSTQVIALHDRTQYRKWSA